MQLVGAFLLFIQFWRGGGEGFIDGVGMLSKKEVGFIGGFVHAIHCVRFQAGPLQM